MRYSAMDIMFMRQAIRLAMAEVNDMSESQVSGSLVEEQLKTYIQAGVGAEDLIQELRKVVEGDA